MDEDLVAWIGLNKDPTTASPAENHRFGFHQWGTPKSSIKKGDFPL